VGKAADWASPKLDGRGVRRSTDLETFLQERFFDFEAGDRSRANGREIAQNGEVFLKEHCGKLVFQLYC
jgi:hypothetical protein